MKQWTGAVKLVTEKQISAALLSVAKSAAGNNCIRSCQASENRRSNTDGNNVKSKVPDTWRNSPVLRPYRFTECSNIFLSVEPLSCTRSKVPPKGKTEIRSSMVMEPAGDTVFLQLHRKTPDRFPETLLWLIFTRMSKPAAHRSCFARRWTFGCLRRWRWRRWRGSTARPPRTWCCCWPDRWKHMADSLSIHKYQDLLRVSSKLIACKMGFFTAPAISRWIQLVWLVNSCENHTRLWSLLDSNTASVLREVHKWFSVGTRHQI